MIYLSLFFAFMGGALLVATFVTYIMCINDWRPFALSVAASVLLCALSFWQGAA